MTNETPINPIISNQYDSTSDCLLKEILQKIVTILHNWEQYNISFISHIIDLIHNCLSILLFIINRLLYLSSMDIIQRNTYGNIKHVTGCYT